MIAGSLSCKLVITEAAEMQLRRGRNLPKGEKVERLFLSVFDPKDTTFGISIVNKKTKHSLAMPVYIIDKDYFTHKTVSLVEVGARLHLKYSKLKELLKKDAERPNKLVRYLAKKASFFKTLPKIVRQAGMILTLLQGQQDFLRDNGIYSPPPFFMSCIRNFYTQENLQYRVGIKLNSPKNAEHFIMGYENGKGDLELVIIDNRRLQRHFLGKGGYGFVDQQWHINSVKYIAYKKNLNKRVNSSVSSIEREYTILNLLYSHKGDNEIALPSPLAFFKSPEGRHVGYLTEVYDGNLESLLRNEECKYYGVFSQNRGQTLKICEKIAKTVAYAHSMQVLHCDIRPCNIFYKKQENGEIQVDLCDWGCAYYAGDGQSYKGSLGICDRQDFIAKRDADTLYQAVKDRNREKIFEILEKVDTYQMGFVFYRLLADGCALPFGQDMNNPIDETFLYERGHSVPLVQLIKSMLDLDIEKRPKVDEVIASLSQLFVEDYRILPGSPADTITSAFEMTIEMAVDALNLHKNKYLKGSMERYYSDPSLGWSS